MKISARNVLRGTVKKIHEGAVNSEVAIQLAGGNEVVSITTKSSVERLGLAVGKPAYVVIKASDVILGTD